MDLTFTLFYEKLKKMSSSEIEKLKRQLQKQELVRKLEELKKEDEISTTGIKKVLVRKALTEIKEILKHLTTLINELLDVIE